MWISWRLGFREGRGDWRMVIGLIIGLLQTKWGAMWVKLV